MDLTVEHPEAVAGLVLMDSGGHSYAQPPPALTSALAGPVANFFAWRGEQDLLPFPHLWRQMDGWRDALAEYLKSGGYQVRSHVTRSALGLTTCSAHVRAWTRCPREPDQAPRPASPRVALARYASTRS